MPEINVFRGTFSRDYYSLEQASKIISEKIQKFEIMDLVHLGASAYIPLSIKIPFIRHLEVTLEFDKNKAPENIVSVLEAGEVVPQWDLNDESMVFDFYRTEENKENTENYNVHALICGVWDIPASAIELLEKEESIRVIEFMWFYPTGINSDSSIIAYPQDMDLVINRNDLVITKDNLDALMSGLEIEKRDESSLHQLNTAKERVSSSAKTAIRVMVNALYPNQSNNFSKLSNLLEAEANSQGINAKFDDSTIARWMKE